MRRREGRSGTGGICVDKYAIDEASSAVAIVAVFDWRAR
jgi:hypothetical protein